MNLLSICWLKPQLLESSASMWIWILTQKEKLLSNSEVQRKSSVKYETHEPPKLEITRMSNKVAYFKIWMPLRDRGHGWLEMTILSKLSETLLGAATQEISLSGKTTAPKLHRLALLPLPSAISEQPRARGWKTVLQCFGEEGGGEGILTNPIYFHRSNVATASNYSRVNSYNL